MAPKFWIPLILLVILCYLGGSNGKKEEPKYRMEKINFVWSKANSQMEPEQMKKLQVDFVCL